jgi:hypothetical protein
MTLLLSSAVSTPGDLLIVSAWLNLERAGMVLMVLVDSMLLNVSKTLL